MIETSLSNLRPDLPNRCAGKRIRNNGQGPFFLDLPTQPVMLNKRMIDVACDKFFRSRAMSQKDSINSWTRRNQTCPR